MVVKTPTGNSNTYKISIPVLKSSELRSKNKTGLCCSMPSGGSLSAGAPGTPDPGAGTYK